MGDDALRALLRRAVAHHDLDHDEAYGLFFDDAAELRTFGHEGLAAARGLFRGGSVVERSTAVDLFCRVAWDTPDDLREACFGALVAAWEEELAGPCEADVIAGSITAFGHLYDARAVPLILPFAAHTSEDVRFSLAHALPGIVGFQPVPDVVAVLLGLSADPDDDVRDWATFGIGQLGADGDDVRRALVARIDDPHPDVRGEALVALGRLGDERAYEPLLVDLAGIAPGEDMGIPLEIEAAVVFADVRLFPVLESLASEWVDESSRGLLDQALRRCDPSLRSTARERERHLLESVRSRLPAAGLPGTVGLEGTFPRTELVVEAPGGDRFVWEIWNEEAPDELDVDLAARRVEEVARSGFAE
ncbi:MAG: HEAT repeat domain-containing protein [Actinomycetota bacterium]